MHTLSLIAFTRAHLAPQQEESGSTGLLLPRIAFPGGKRSRWVNAAAPALLGEGSSRRGVLWEGGALGGRYSWKRGPPGVVSSGREVLWEGGPAAIKPYYPPLNVSNLPLIGVNSLPVTCTPLPHSSLLESTPQ